MIHSMQRRQFITLLGGAAAAWPLVAQAQQPGLPVIGFLNSGVPAHNTFLPLFLQGLRDTGYVEGQNVSIEYRWAEDQIDRLPALAADLVRRQVRVIVAPDIVSALAAKAETNTIPILFVVGSDPVRAGLVASLNRPGGNATGVANLNQELMPKRLELLHELVPGTKPIAILRNPTNPSAETSLNILQAAANVLGRQLVVVNASNEREIHAAFATLVELQPGALLIVTDFFLNFRRAQLGVLTLQHAIPTAFQFREFAAAGGLISYGASSSETNHIIGDYAGRILKGTTPADLPVQQATKIELIINMKTAKALSLAFPTALLVRADEVIE